MTHKPPGRSSGLTSGALLDLELLRQKPGLPQYPLSGGDSSRGTCPLIRALLQAAEEEIPLANAGRGPRPGWEADLVRKRSQNNSCPTQRAGQKGGRRNSTGGGTWGRGHRGKEAQTKFCRGLDAQTVKPRPARAQPGLPKSFSAALRGCAVREGGFQEGFEAGEGWGCPTKPWGGARGAHGAGRGWLGALGCPLQPPETTWQHTEPSRGF